MVADDEGFEPSIRYSPMSVYQTGAFDRSANHPCQRCVGTGIYENGEFDL